MKDIDEIQMRDVFFTKLYHYAKDNSNIVILSNDLGAVSLDLNIGKTYPHNS